MLTINKILFPTDFTRCSEQALHHALHFATAFQAQLDLLHVVALYEEDPNHPRRRFPEAIQSMAEAAGLQIKTDEVRGVTAVESILDYAADGDYDLIAMGTHGRRGIGHLLFDSVTEHVVRHSICPVLSVRERKVFEPVEARFSNILVPFDFSTYSRRALRYGRELAALFGANLQVLHVIDERMLPPFYNKGVTSTYDINPNVQAETLSALEEAYDHEKGPEVSTTFNVRQGQPGREVLRFEAETGSDLMVIATHGSSGIEHLLLGSVTEQLIRRATCPVFTVRLSNKMLVQESRAENAHATPHESY